MKIPKPLTNVIESFQKLPGIGPKTAQRLSYYLLHVPQTELEHFAESLSKLKKETVLCTICKNVSEYDPCPVCSDTKRDTNTILVVEQPLDVLAFERVGQYDGMYHVLHGAINPLENIGPDEIFIGDLLSRVKSASVESFGEVKEIIIATNPTMEGDATAMYIAKKIREITTNGEVVKITRLGMGVPTGADLEYADEATLREAIDGRRAI
ncbi:recombination protein RecR [Candidatus Woesebacteria bacterium RIFCSPLOWO2_01_FULL_39_61]|uniref:Recombination protein RecR n=1 Tax=Candidatus Woesebacteria bacterium RIFCSPHIGHO2_02_FULL_39_13 TaxID=1802505 RepID=A0A1F7Z608_9BACT|nr:MAG: recombination protein RecR [Candidatus Woesebacteria bacterium RIFCSPHIGHO2_01_FULL_39_95]OGM34891.1 MAG: recombination protein RecR [Candidatus Woesebacteria bacterium RIFCSPHIGHO2_02_FULL_39_13]OGM38009.1 MAG: recombination protein RecR [Candidatus Woesebacteria bacterium RIFCSPHIGHO2_12_FULL_40_20]OGM66625.1 MAG: recombination protein RecR [Candidatus Woesebacteria bacterium RIFCSPLOWO2_01_FULL_39_61]OGM73738.1 MAG: recombination protein RecR [Candidatus Woesebacteria bacterium RIFCS